MTDRHEIEQLTPHLVRGDEEAFRALVGALGEPLFAFAFTRLGDAARAQDVVQTAFIRIYRRRARLRQGTLRAYCFCVVENLTRDSVRDATLRVTREREAAAMRPETSTSDPQRTAMAREAWNAALQLPCELRDVVMLHHGQGLSLAEAGVVLDIPKGSVQTRLQRALETLRTRLGASAMAAPAIGLGELLGSHPGFAAPAAAPPMFLSNLEKVVMATIGQKSAVSATALLMVLLLLGGLSVGGYLLFKAPAGGQGASGHGESGAGGSDAATLSRAGQDNGGELATSTHQNTNRSAANAAVKDSGEPRKTATSDAAEDDPDGAATKGEVSVPVPNPRDPKNINFSMLTLHVMGKVLDPRGAPVIDAELKCYSQGVSNLNRPGPTLASGPTDVEGRFDIRVNLKDYVPEQNEDLVDWLRIYIVLKHPDYVFGATQATARFDPARYEYVADNLEIRVQQPLDILVQVVNEEDIPVSGATVIWERYYTNFQAPRLPDGTPLKFRTDHAGSVGFKLPVFGDEVISYRVDGSARILAVAPGYVGTVHPVRAYPQGGPSYSFKLALRRGVELAGVIEDDAGVVLSNLPFFLAPEGGEWFCGEAAQPPVTDSEGRFSLLVAPDMKHFTVEAEGFIPLRGSLRTPPPRLDVKLVLQRMRRVSLRFVEKGEVRNLWSYRVNRAADGKFMRSRATSKTIDKAEFSELPPGRYVITALLMGWEVPVEYTFEVGRGNLDLTIPVVRPAGYVTVRGRVLDPDKKPVSDARVQIQTSENASCDEEDLPCRAITDAQGWFSMPVVKAGERVFIVTGTDYPDLTQTVVIGRDTGPLELVLTRPVVGGLRVKAPAMPANSQQRFNVVVIDAAGKEHEGLGSGAEFNFDRLAPGRARVRLESSAFRTVAFEGDVFERVVEVAAGQTAELTFHYAPNVRIGGLVARDGRAQNRAEVWLFRVAPNFSREEMMIHSAHYGGWKTWFVADTEGRFVAEGLAVGAYWARVVINRESFWVYFALTEAPQQEVEINVVDSSK